VALREIGDRGESYEVLELTHRRDFDRVWLSIIPRRRAAIEREINRRLDELIQSPDANWGTITNTSIEGGKPNPFTGERGSWRGTAFQYIYEACGQSQDRAALFFGNIWKKVIIERPDRWIGIRSDPTFPRRGITLLGKTYFQDTNSQFRSERKRQNPMGGSTAKNIDRARKALARIKPGRKPRS